MNLGFAPPSNAYLKEENLKAPESYYPLKIEVCDKCWLVQTEDYANADELFSSEYAYFSSTSSSWLSHASVYSKAMITDFNLGVNSFVIEIASNDGYLLRNFLAAGIPCLGIEPTAGPAAAAEQIGIPVLREFFDESLGKTLSDQGSSADLIVGNNVYAHVPDINSFTRGLKQALKPDGIITLEFPHLLQMIRNTQFDTVYHEHFSYLSLGAVCRIFSKADLRVWDVEQISTHGGSLRVFGCHAESEREDSHAVIDLLTEEIEFGLQKIETYQHFQLRADLVKNDLLSFLINQKLNGKSVAAYGAAAKGNTLLNYAGVKPDLLSFVCDAAPAKQNKYMPGSHIPILSPSVLIEKKPDFILILPWNIAEEIQQQNSAVKDWGGKFVIAIPDLRVLP